MLTSPAGACAVLAATMLLASCSPSGTDASVQEARAPEPVSEIGGEAPAPSLVINTAVPALRFLTIGMSDDELKAHDVPVSWGTRNLEGESYDVATVELEPGATAIAVFGLDKRVHSLEVDNGSIRDNHGLGVGATLGELQAAYPEGRLIYGLEEGRHASFLTGGMLVFRFDPADLDEACFASPPVCEPQPGLAARKLVLFGQPVP